jgi:ribosome-associated heat shock protein Hsp15
MNELQKIRIDKYLWAIRLFKTRSLATRAIEAGDVTCFGEKIKASRTTKVGEQFEVYNGARDWVIQVTALLDKRVGAALAVQYYKDLSPEPDKKEKLLPESFFFYTGKRRSKIGRPTKKSRRDLDTFTGK